LFSKILIANRGEIACRVIKTAREMGIATVAVYSDADREALHVRLADEAVHIGAGPASQSYLLADRIIEACRETGAEAVHPGYGFLSENPKFCEALTAAGLVFIGPPAGAIEAMGDKITSKKIAAEAGVSTVPGHMGLIESADEALTIAREIGYPVMLKASAGGGGKGMRIAWNDEEAREGFERAKSEAKSSFGDDRIFIEKFVTQPRHIEIQVLADRHGNAVYLGERECSIQRRNQKVIEEAPSPFLDQETRTKMGEQAVALARAVGYESAGTVEFIVDGEKNFYFLEMNTRLQVEHPVTELITGLDLVAEMFRIAAGEPLALAQEDVTLDGWAIESRIYAEDPYRNFLPSVGRLTRYRPPAEFASAEIRVRNDTGVYEGGEISTFYDPMIAKLCTWAPSREAAVGEMARALDRFEVEGVGHNVPFLQAVMGQARFRAGDLTTGYIAEEFPDGFAGVSVAPEIEQALGALALYACHFQQSRRYWDKRMETMSVLCGEARRDYAVHPGTGGVVLASDGGEALAVKSGWMPGEHLISGSVNGVEYTAGIETSATGAHVRYRGARLDFRILRTAVAELMGYMPVKEPPDLSRMLLCPMPGQVVRLEVAEGEIVEDGQALAIVEAMKMENVLRAEKRVRVAAINAAVGDNLAVDTVIMEFEDP